MALNEGMHEGEFIGELAMGPGYHIDQITVASGQNLQAGAVLGRLTSGGNYVAFNPAASDGSQNAAGILVPACNATGGATVSRALLRGPAMVNRNDLVFGGGVNGTQQNTAVAALLALGIKAV